MTEITSIQRARAVIALDILYEWQNKRLDGTAGVVPKQSVWYEEADVGELPCACVEGYLATRVELMDLGLRTVEGICSAKVPLFGELQGSYAIGEFFGMDKNEAHRIAFIWDEDEALEAMISALKEIANG